MAILAKLSPEGSEFSTRQQPPKTEPGNAGVPTREIRTPPIGRPGGD
jgi:hypothetical protein